MKNRLKSILILTIAAILLCSCTITNNKNSDKDDIDQGKTQVTSKPDKDSDQENSESKIVYELISKTAPEFSLEMAIIQKDFNLNLLKAINNADENVFYSQMSISTALTGIYFATGGETSKEIKDTLCYKDMTDEDIISAQKAIIESYKNSGDTTVSVANSIWLDDSFTAKQGYIDAMKDMLLMQVSSLNLQAPDAINIINDWVNEKTNEMIPKIFEDNELKEAVFTLINTVYFNGEWTMPFDPELTNKSEFNGSKGASTVDMMFMKNDILGYEDETYKAIKLFYGEDERFAMNIILPEGDIDSFINSLTADSLNDMLNNFEEKADAKIMIPKFTLEEKIKLNDVLSYLGMPTAFTSYADFRNISDSSLMIDQVLHKAKIKVDEEGTEAAAVTAITVKLTSVSLDSFTFTADKPFLFFIEDTQTDMILFTGKVSNLG